ncbi:DUF4349 domain-containing protein [Patulibacter defluvii]|uniref:DUF4349 domain-containing protein n=1 Tax=Patulibacter defluvii TaxID=3095358 RepID=UPI002A75341E|nr:DUF4349 domain-containing protein [Patulibacter sp. DM4]
MWGRESQLDPEIRDELEALEAALAGDPDADRELAALVADVAAAKPALDPAARGRLDERVERALHPAPSSSEGGAGSSAVRRRPSRMASWRPALAVMAATALVVPVAVVALGGGDGGSSDTTALSTQAMDRGAATVPAPAPGKSLDGEGGAAGSSSAGETGDDAGRGGAATTEASPTIERQSAPTTVAPDSGATSGELARDRVVVRDVDQVVRVGRDQVGRATNRVTSIVEGAGGYLADSQVRERGSDAGASFQVVVPTARLDATVAQLSRIGRLVRLDRSTQDVTSQAVSLADQLADVRADRQSVRRQLAAATSPQRRAALRRELNLLSSRIARLEGRQRVLRRQTDTSRIRLALVTSGDDAIALPAAEDGRWGIGDALDDAGRVVEVAGGVLLIAGVILVPLGLVAGAALALRRRRRAAAADQLVDAA